MAGVYTIRDAIKDKQITAVGACLCELADADDILITMTNYSKSTNMKRVLFMAIAAIAMISCSDDSTSGQGTGGQGSQPKTEPATQVYIQGNKTAATRAAAAKVNKKRAYFFIRLDNRIAGTEDCKSGDYFPQDAFGNTVRLPYNKGYIDADYAY